MSSKKFLPFLLLLALLLSACNFPTSSEPEIDPAAQVQTAAAETVNAQFTQNAELTPEETPTPEPTNTPEATATEEAPPEPTATEEVAEATATSTGICDSVFFVTDVTIPDGTEFAPGESFTKTWRLRNAGTCTWTTDYDLVFDSGAAMDGPASQALLGDVAPGEEVDVSVVLTAPAAEGEYTGNWKLRNDSGVVFGLPDAFYVEIKVVVGGGASGTTVTLAATDRGSVRSDSSTNPNPNTGDTDADIGSQAFVSFDISGIPAGATITQVRVDFSDYDTLGDPFTALGCLRAYQGSFFALDASDYSGSALGAVLRWCDTSELNTAFLDEDVESSLQGVLGASTYELRLQFNETETNSDGVADMVRFGTVELEVTYTAP